MEEAQARGAMLAGTERSPKKWRSAPERSPCPATEEKVTSGPFLAARGGAWAPCPSPCLPTLSDFDAERTQISIPASAALLRWKALEQVTNPCS